MWWLSLLACQEPFALDRHDLAGFRIAAVDLAAIDEGRFSPRVAVVVEGRPWSEDPVELAWSWVDSIDEAAGLDNDAPVEAEGPVVALDRPEAPELLALRATEPGGGAVATAVIEVPAGPSRLGPLPPITLRELSLRLATVNEEQLTLEARRERDGEPTGRIAPGGLGRLAVEAPEGIARWMATGGSFLELDRTVTDWVAGDLRLDDGEIEGSRSPLEDEAVTVIGLVVSEDGPTPEGRFRARDILVQAASDEGVWVAGRWIPTSPAVASDPGTVLRGTLEADDRSPTGVRLVDSVVVSRAEAEARGFGTDALACAAVSGPFDPGWLLEQRCARSQVDGREVYLVTDPADGS